MFAAVSNPPWASDDDPASTIFVRAGTSAVVICAPHGGTLEPPSVPDRAAGCHEPDTNTAQLAWAVWGALAGGTAALVVGKLHRRKVDLGRSRAGAAESVAGRAAWDEYHGAIRAALAAAIAAHGHAHLFDLHGQCHRPGATEVGHMLTNSELRDGSAAGGGSCSVADERGRADGLAPSSSGASTLRLERSSLGAMVSLRAFAGLEDAVRGEHAIGTLLERGGGGGGGGASFRAVPSASTPHPCCCVLGSCGERAGMEEGEMKPGVRGVQCACSAFDAAASTQWDGTSARGHGRCAFFWGANTIAMYGGGREVPVGSSSGSGGAGSSGAGGGSSSDVTTSSQLPAFRGRVAATQLETGWTGARESDAQLKRFGVALARAIAGFMRHFYGETAAGVAEPGVVAVAAATTAPPPVASEEESRRTTNKRLRSGDGNGGDADEGAGGGESEEHCDARRRMRPRGGSAAGGY